MKVKAKLISALTAGITAVMSVIGTAPQDDIRADMRTTTDAPVYDAPAVVLGDTKGMPGDTVTVPLNVYCNNDLSAFDTIIAWDDPSLECSLAYAGTVQNMNGIVSDKGVDYCFVMLSLDEGSSSGITDGTAAYINFTIPQDAVQGTVYELYFDTVDSFSDMSGNDLRGELEKHSGTITVGEGAVTTAASEPTETTVTTVSHTQPSPTETTVSHTEPPLSETTVSSEIQEYDDGYALMMSSGKGKAGDTVTIDLMSLCGNAMEALDAVISWDDAALKLTNVYSSDINGSTDHLTADGMCSIMVIGDSIPDGVIAGLEFMIPDDAVQGTVYELYFDTVSTFYSSDGVEHAGRIGLQNGSITVTDRAGKIVTTAPDQDSDPSTATTVSSNSSTSSTSLSISKEKVDMMIGDSLHLKVNGSSGAVKWSSSDPDTVTVNSKGAIKALKKGSALIIAYVDGVYLTSEVNVESDDPSGEYLLGDANEDGSVNVRDAAYIAKCLSKGVGSTLPPSADFNVDGKTNVRDAASIAKYLASGKLAA